MDRIPLSLVDAAAVPEAGVEIEAAAVATGLGLDEAAFRRLMEVGKVSVLCERGVGEHAGQFRATFYSGDRRFRAVLDAGGRILEANGQG
ncbi:hypothetical protein CO641_08970 [Lysobacteraceae bacterium NML91-0213]|nr:hypothetical protein CO641_08970 [Xanthomonadaceae bacterium NML91-0213]